MLYTFEPKERIEPGVLDQIEQCERLEEGSRAVLCADNHLGYGCPIGGVIAYRGLVSPSAVGVDIGCGNMAVRTNARADGVNVGTVMDDICRLVSFGMGRKNHERVDHPILDDIAHSPVPMQRELVKLAADQLGTVGGGNHYVDLFEDYDGWLWVGVHFGSRGFGFKTANWAVAQTQHKVFGKDPVVIPADSHLGQSYIEAMNLAGAYAYASREWVVNCVLGILGARATHTVHNHHNFAWPEVHGGTRYWVHRKGSTPALPGQQGFIGASMGEAAVIVEGVDHPHAEHTLYSTVHGAGRAMSRTKAAGRVKRGKSWVCGERACLHDGQGYPARDYRRGPNGELPRCPACGGKLFLRDTRTQLAPGLIDWPAVQAELVRKGIELRGGAADEAPGAYKRLSEVLTYHTGTVRVLHTLQPLGVAMAGADEFDPFKD
jgi:tRNA-splicing ligase RtcB